MASQLSAVNISSAKPTKPGQPVPQNGLTSVSANFGARGVECLRLERNGALGREPGLPQ